MPHITDGSFFREQRNGRSLSIFSCLLLTVRLYLSTNLHATGSKYLQWNPDWYGQIPCVCFGVDGRERPGGGNNKFYPGLQFTLQIVLHTSVLLFASGWVGVVGGWRMVGGGGGGGGVGRQTTIKFSRFYTVRYTSYRVLLCSAKR